MFCHTIGCQVIAIQTSYLNVCCFEFYFISCLLWVRALKYSTKCFIIHFINITIWSVTLAVYCTSSLYFLSCLLNPCTPMSNQICQLLTVSIFQLVLSPFPSTDFVDKRIKRHTLLRKLLYFMLTTLFEILALVVFWIIQHWSLILSQLLKVPALGWVYRASLMTWVLVWALSSVVICVELLLSLMIV